MSFFFQHFVTSSFCSYKYHSVKISCVSVNFIFVRDVIRNLYDSFIFSKWGNSAFWTNIAVEIYVKKKPISKWIIRAWISITYRYAGLNEYIVQFRRYFDSHRRKKTIQTREKEAKHTEGKMLWQLMSDTEARVKYFMSFIIE